jgi:hypothetical protein
MYNVQQWFLTWVGGKSAMNIRIAMLAVAMLACWFGASEARAAMGLRCSDWLNARAHMRYDERTKRYVEANPPGAPPVSDEVDRNGALLGFYVAGIVDTLMWLDPWLSKMAEAPGVELPPKVTVESVMVRVEQLCRGGLQKDLRDYDALDIVSQNNQATIMLRVMAFQQLLEKYMKAGR